MRRSHHYRWRASNFDHYSAVMAIEQWGFFSLPHLMWHGASVNTCIMVNFVNPWHSHLLPSVWQWSCHNLFFTTQVCREWDSNAQPSAFEANALTDCTKTRYWPKYSNFTHIGASPLQVKGWKIQASVRWVRPLRREVSLHLYHAKPTVTPNLCSFVPFESESDAIMFFVNRM